MFANTAAPDKRSPQNSPSKFVPEDPFAEATQIREEPRMSYMLILVYNVELSLLLDRPRDKGKKSYFKKKSSFTKHTGPDIKKSDQEEDELTFKISNPKYLIFLSFNYSEISCSSFLFFTC